MAVKTYESNGVALSKKTIYSGDKIKISYNGLLAQAGAQDIFLYTGYGEQWADSSLVPMEKNANVFSAEIDIKAGSTLGLCFKDAIENWDNNSGENYIFKISAKKAEKVEKTEKATKTVKAKVTDADESKTKKKATAKKSSPKKIKTE